MLISSTIQENGEVTVENGSPRALHYPFSVNEKVIIKVNNTQSACFNIFPF